jgi:NAD(P)-dependent dehydrogenase (short-subunit alcohol dehydrogenase family)
MTTATSQRQPELTGQTVVVIGGAGIGLETARRARAEGAGMILTGRDPGPPGAGRGRIRRAEQRGLRRRRPRRARPVRRRPTRREGWPPE